MPLSEEEQKMLEEIERSFYDNDPGLARTVGLPRSSGPSRAPIVFGTAAIVGGLALIILGLSRHVAISYVGFLAMLGGSFALVGHLRQLAHQGISAITHRIIDTTNAANQNRQTGNRPTRRRTDRPESDPDTKR